MKKILLVIFLLLGYLAQAQTVGQFRYDTTKFLKVGGRNHVMIDSLIQVTDSTYKALVIGADGVIKKITYWPGSGKSVLPGYGVTIDSTSGNYVVSADTSILALKDSVRLSQPLYVVGDTMKFNPDSSGLVKDIYKKAGTDSVFKTINGVDSFAFLFPSGGSIKTINLKSLVGTGNVNLTLQDITSAGFVTTDSIIHMVALGNKRVSYLSDAAGEGMVGVSYGVPGTSARLRPNKLELTNGSHTATIQTVSGTTPTTFTLPSDSSGYAILSIKIPAISPTVYKANFQGTITLPLYNNWIRPEDFGALGNGTANDRSAVQAAINTGKAVLLTKVYNIDSGLVIPSGTKIFGFNDNLCGLVSTVTNINILEITGENITLENFYIKGFSNYNQKGISLKNTSITSNTKKNIKIDKLRLYLLDIGIYDTLNVGTYYSGGLRITNTMMQQCKIGVYFDNRAEYNLISNSHFLYCGIGFYSRGGNNSMSSSFITGCDTAIVLKQGVNDGHNSFTGVTANHNGFSVYIDTLNNGYAFNSCNFYVGKMFIRQANKIRFSDCGIYADSITTINADTISFINSTFTKTPIVSTTTSNINWRGNNFKSGTPIGVNNVSLSSYLSASLQDGAIEFDGVNFYSTSGGVRYILTRTLTGTAAPTITPQAVGINFIDTVNKKVYVSTGTSSSGDWNILN